MPLVISVSGVRGTLGSSSSAYLSPQVLVDYLSAYVNHLREHRNNLGGASDRLKVVIGRDGRISGEAVSQLTAATLRLAGVDVVDLGLSTTPTVELAVTRHEADGGIVLSASHNPREYNALKLLNERGEFLSAEAGADIASRVQARRFEHPGVDDLGHYRRSEDDIAYHVQAILALEQVDVEAVRAAGLHVVVDCINSTGALALPPLLDALGVSYELLFEEVSGNFAHEAEPLPKNLSALSERVAGSRADLGLAVDPDVDRLVLVGEDGSMLGEEYTLALVADYLLPRRPGPVVSNLSSSRVLRDVAARHGQDYYAAPVGEVHVVRKMREVDAAFGGEGNGGIIDPASHYGRDALVGVAYVLSYLATSGKTASELRAALPDYTIVKEKLALPDRDRVPSVLAELQQRYEGRGEIDLQDGVRIDLPQGWVHLRASNTEPIVRVIAEAADETAALSLAREAKGYMQDALEAY